jgi:hypothetical protein
MCRNLEFIVRLLEVRLHKAFHLSFKSYSKYLLQVRMSQINTYLSSLFCGYQFRFPSAFNYVNILSPAAYPMKVAAHVTSYSRPFEHDWWKAYRLLHNLSYPLIYVGLPSSGSKVPPSIDCQTSSGPRLLRHRFYTNFALIYFVCHSCAAHISPFFIIHPSTTMTDQPIFILYTKIPSFLPMFSSPSYLLCYVVVFKSIYFKTHSFVAPSVIAQNFNTVYR